MKSLLFSILALLLLFPVPALADNLYQADLSCEEEVIVQADDWLSKIAEKHYGSVFVYPAIAEATNVKNASDGTFAFIENYDVIEIGWKLCIPSEADAEPFLQQAQSPAVETADSAASDTAEPVGRLVLATTTSTENSGLLAAILPVTGPHLANEARLLQTLSDAEREQLAGLLRKLNLGLPPL
jgi:hypothetical protein